MRSYSLEKQETVVSKAELDVELWQELMSYRQTFNLSMSEVIREAVIEGMPHLREHIQESRYGY